MPTPSKPILPTVLCTSARYPAIPATGLVSSLSALPELFQAAGLDPINPFAAWVQPGMKVLVKPNWVRHAASGWASLDALVTHPSILRGVVEGVAAALRNSSGQIEGEIVLADAPLQSGNFDLLLSQCGLHPLLAHWQQLGWPVHLRDLRRIIASTDDATAVVEELHFAVGDPTGDTVVDLGVRSRHEGAPPSSQGYGVSNYDHRTTTQHHAPGRHCYRIANSLLDADVVINLPKWKTHVKTGVTGALKNFIGVNCDKAYLPHFRPGSPRQGGDEYPPTRGGFHFSQVRGLVEQCLPAAWLRGLRKVLLKSTRSRPSSLVFGGGWPGNDTLWRTVHDMAFVARWANSKGQWRATPRPVLTILDAIVAGQGDGPLRPEPYPMGCLLFGTDPGAVDVFAAALSGFDWRRIPALSNLTDPAARPISDFHPAWPLPAAICQLAPPSAWRTHLQYNVNAYAA